jgi:hypothetical protein
MINNDRVNQVKFSIRFSNTERVLEVHDVEIPSVIADIFGFNSWDHVKTIFDCIKNSHGYGSNGSGIYFPEEAAEAGESQDGVLVYNPIYELEFYKSAFYLSANRYLSAVMSLGEKNHDKMLNTMWGKEFSEYVKALPREKFF